MTRAVAWIVVRLRVVVLAAWIAVAIVVTVELPGLSQAEPAPLGGLVPASSRAQATEERSVEIFGVPLLGRTAVVQREPDGLTVAARGRVLERAVTASTGEGEPRLALPVVGGAGGRPGRAGPPTTAVTFLFAAPGASVAAQTPGRGRVRGTRPRRRGPGRGRHRRRPGDARAVGGDRRCAAAHRLGGGRAGRRSCSRCCSA